MMFTGYAKRGNALLGLLARLPCINPIIWDIESGDMSHSVVLGCRSVYNISFPAC